MNGNIPILKKNPIINNDKPIRKTGDFNKGVEERIVVRFVVPMIPYIKAIPYNKNPVINAPRRKYFNALSFDFILFLKNPAST